MIVVNSFVFANGFEGEKGMTQAIHFSPPFFARHSLTATGARSASIKCSIKMQGKLQAGRHANSAALPSWRSDGRGLAALDPVRFESSQSLLS
jgi:hypothetical protein